MMSEKSLSFLLCIIAISVESSWLWNDEPKLTTLPPETETTEMATEKTTPEPGLLGSVFDLVGGFLGPPNSPTPQTSTSVSPEGGSMPSATPSGGLLDTLLGAGKFINNVCIFM
uniref:Uncharacterized protein n=1 Tax=Trichobilharzia regenti TaxID=157069 RepID=A0AA85JPE2_TRIRE|nr:unnamed protein product [Trichobilharzia regenti]